MKHVLYPLSYSPNGIGTDGSRTRDRMEFHLTFVATDSNSTRFQGGDNRLVRILASLR